jgi:hypothetical protein
MHLTCLPKHPELVKMESIAEFANYTELTATDKTKLENILKTNAKKVRVKDAKHNNNN